ncbi:MAG: DUF4476 domain-containing protein [Proteobacteria bacterium]|nr:DUF4476 domain-containing protein [Pseudomonadota bacterium]
MKWYHSIILACGLALVAPQISMAQPGHPGPQGDHRDGAHPGQPNNPGQPGKASDKIDDRGHQNNHPGANHPNGRPGDPNHPGANHPNGSPGDPNHPGANHPNGRPGDPGHPGMREMDPKSFSELLNAVSRPAVAGNKLARIRAAAKNNYFTADQVRQLMKADRLENDKIIIAVELYKRVIDKNNWHVIYSALTFSSSKQEVDRRLGL